MSKFKELQEQHQRSPKEPNPFLQDASVVRESRTVAEAESNSEAPSLVFNEDSSVAVNVDLSVTEPVLPPDGSPNDGALEPEVIDNQVQPDTPPTDHEGEE